LFDDTNGWRNGGAIPATIVGNPRRRSWGKVVFATD
jgi:hypothetical protein